MQKIGASTASANAQGEFTEGNPGAGVAATLLKAAWLNAVQRELVHLVEGAGLLLDDADDSQILKAIKVIQTNASTWLKLSGKPTTIAGFGITDAFTKAETTSAIQQRIADLVASSPATLDTLKELADALGNDPNFATTMTNALAAKANKATTLGGYGITDAYPKAATYSRAEVDELLKYATSLPVGGMVPFPKGGVPAGFLEVDGSVQSVAVYPELAAYLGTTFNKGDEGAGNFRLPESRGDFFRGWDHGRGVDPGRSIGSWQADEFKKHRHAAPNSDAAGGVSGSWLYADLGNAAMNYDNYTKDEGGSETRPRNLAVMWCIKAWNAPINQGNIDIAALAALAAQATEINQGTTKVATTTQMLDSANDFVMPTPKKLRWGFSISLAANGYIAFPSWLGGLVLQWGTSVGFSSTPVVVTFPMAFPNAAFAVVATTHIGTTNAVPTQDAVASFGLSQTGVSFRTNAGAAPNGAKYIAIGS